MAVVGVMHFVRPGFVVRQVPRCGPHAGTGVLLTGVVELAIGAALVADWHPSGARVAGAILITSYPPVHVEALRTAPTRAARPVEALRFPVNAVDVGVAILLTIGG